MYPLPPVRERTERDTVVTSAPVKRMASPLRPMRLETISPTRVPAGKKVSVRVAEKLTAIQDPRVQHELKEMQETSDLREIDDDVEDAATLYEWQALEHTHQPKTQTWFVTLAAVTTVAIGASFFFGNIIGAITLGLAGGLVYYLSQFEPAMVRYRILVDGVATNNLLYHFKQLTSFNIVYLPGETKTVILRGKKMLSPHIHMELGDADPVAVRELLLEFLQEDQDMEESIVDIWARRLGF